MLSGDRSHNGYTQNSSFKSKDGVQAPILTLSLKVAMLTLLSTPSKYAIETRPVSPRSGS